MAVEINPVYRWSSFSLLGIPCLEHGERPFIEIFPADADLYVFVGWTPFDSEKNGVPSLSCAASRRSVPFPCILRTALLALAATLVKLIGSFSMIAPWAC